MARNDSRKTAGDVGVVGIIVAGQEEDYGRRRGEVGVQEVTPKPPPPKAPITYFKDPSCAKQEGKGQRKPKGQIPYARRQKEKTHRGDQKAKIPKWGDCEGDSKGKDPKGKGARGKDPKGGKSLGKVGEDGEAAKRSYSSQTA